MKRRTIGVAALTVGLASVMGLGAGTALAVIPPLLSPVGVAGPNGSATEQMPKPEYPRNSNGQTYGSAALAPEPDAEPDLILVMATNGIEGYVRKSELDDANGAAAAATFTSPEQALEWQEANSGDRYVPVYDREGEQIIGEFLIVGSDSQDPLPSEVHLD